MLLGRDLALRPLGLLIPEERGGKASLVIDFTPVRNILVGENIWIVDDVGWTTAVNLH